MPIDILQPPPCATRPALSAAEVHLVRSSFALVAPLATQAAAMFYDRVFERAPGAAALFHGDMAAQGQRLMAMVQLAVDGLDDPVGLAAVLADLGRRHVGYGVQPGHYDLVGGALLDTLAAALGARFTPAHRQAWAAFFDMIRRGMQASA